MERWALTAHLRAAVSCNFKELCGVISHSDKKELSPKTTKESEKAVSLLVESINQLENPFSCNPTTKELHNIATGSIATEEMRDDISNAKVRGKEATMNFLKDRLIDQKVSFWTHYTRCS